MKPQMAERSVEYITSNKKVYPLQVSMFNIDANCIPYNHYRTKEACRNGCSLYCRNGGCPPFAPSYLTLSAKYSHAIVIFIKLMTMNFPEKSLNSKHYIRWNFTESFMPGLLKKSLAELANKLTGYPLSSGHCKSCRKCNYKMGEKRCLNPEKRTYSLEATGINVEELMLKFTDSPLLWWQRDKHEYIPEYQMRTGLVLHNRIIDENKYEKLFQYIYSTNFKPC